MHHLLILIYKPFNIALNIFPRNVFLIYSADWGKRSHFDELKAKLGYFFRSTMLEQDKASYQILWNGCGLDVTKVWAYIKWHAFFLWFIWYEKWKKFICQSFRHLRPKDFQMELVVSDHLRNNITENSSYLAILNPIECFFQVCDFLLRQSAEWIWNLDYSILGMTYSHYLIYNIDGPSLFLNSNI